jgi:hypothetical protein
MTCAREGATWSVGAFHDAREDRCLTDRRAGVAPHPLVDAMRRRPGVERIWPSGGPIGPLRGGLDMDGLCTW